MKSLEKVSSDIDKEKIIETFQNKTESEGIKHKSTKRRFRYCNGGFCKKGVRKMSVDFTTMKKTAVSI